MVLPDELFAGTGRDRELGVRLPLRRPRMTRSPAGFSRGVAKHKCEEVPRGVRSVEGVSPVQAAWQRVNCRNSRSGEVRRRVAGVKLWCAWR